MSSYFVIYYKEQTFEDEDLKNSYYETLDKNFIQALNFCEKEFTHKELLELLQNGNVVQRQIAALRLETITSKEDAVIFVSNLTGQDGKIREVVSFRLKEFMADKSVLPYFHCKDNYEKFLDAITDINASICRNVISAVVNLREDKAFCEYFCRGLEDMAENLLDVVEKFDIQEGKYKINKEAFKLYWCLETIYEFWDKLDLKRLKGIIIRAKKIREYTIREKAAKILTHPFEDEELLFVRQELKNDENYYVRRI